MSPVIPRFADHADRRVGLAVVGPSVPAVALISVGARDFRAVVLPEAEIRGVSQIRFARGVERFVAQRVVSLGQLPVRHHQVGRLDLDQRAAIELGFKVRLVGRRAAGILNRAGRTSLFVVVERGQLMPDWKLTKA